MLDVIYRLFEMLALLVCLHNFYGVKFKLDIYNIGFISLELVFMQMMQDNIVSKEMYFLMYIMYFIYAYIRFNEDIKKVLLKCMLAVSLVVCLQMIVYIPMSFIYYILPNETIIIAVINFAVFLLVFLTSKSDKYKKVACFCTKKDWLLWACLLLGILVIIYCIFSLKVSNIINIDLFILVSLFVILFLMFLQRWQKSIYELQRKEREIQIANLYNGVFKELIESIRKKQHDFNNHIDAIYSMSLTSSTMEELIDKQKEYCGTLIFESRYTKVLGSINNSTIAGFIYSKFSIAEKDNIDVDYNIAYSGNSKISVYDLVEIIGTLIDNAIEAVREIETPKKIVFEFNDVTGVDLCIRNPVLNLTNNDLEKFFVKGYTTKETGNGIGLSKVKEYQSKYNMDIFVKLINVDKIDWLEFRIKEK